MPVLVAMTNPVMCASLAELPRKYFLQKIIFIISLSSLSSLLRLHAECFVRITYLFLLILVFVNRVSVMNLAAAVLGRSGHLETSWGGGRGFLTAMVKATGKHALISCMRSTLLWLVCLI